MLLTQQTVHFMQHIHNNSTFPIKHEMDLEPLCALFCAVHTYNGVLQIFDAELLICLWFLLMHSYNNQRSNIMH